MVAATRAGFLTVFSEILVFLLSFLCCGALLCLNPGFLRSRTQNKDLCAGSLFRNGLREPLGVKEVLRREVEKEKANTNGHH